MSKSQLFESLEDRRMFSATVAASVDAYGNLTVTGTTANDSITITEHYGTATVKSGTATVGTFSAVKSVLVKGNGGNDTVNYTGYDFGATINVDANDTVNLTDYSSSTAFHSLVQGATGGCKIYVNTAYGATIRCVSGNNTIGIQGGNYANVYAGAGADVITISSGVGNTTLHNTLHTKYTNLGTNTLITT